MKQNKIYIYGKHAVSEALLHAPRVVRKVYLAEKFDDKEIRTLLKKSGVPVEPLEKSKVTSMVEGNAAHQGIVAFISLGELVTQADYFLETFVPSKNSLLVLLSDVQDPHNVGAIIRSAAAFGATAVLMPSRNQSPVTGAVVKASAGMAFHVPLIALDNMQQTVAAIKKMGVTVYGLAPKGAVPLEREPFPGPTLLVLGNEAQGVAPAARALCDTMLSISTKPTVESLNVAASAAVALYAWNLKQK